MRRFCVLGLAAAAAFASPASADIFKGKTITIVTSTGSGGSLDTIARLVSRHMHKHIDGGPTMIVQNMPGAGNVLATNFMYAVAPKDGTTIATVNNTIPLHQVMGGQGVRYDVREFMWLGSTGAENSVFLVWHTAGVKTIEDARKTEVVVGGTGVGSGTVIYPTVMNNLLGTKFKIVFGYKSSEDVNVALERGEVQGRSFALRGIYAQHPDWISDKKIAFIAQIGAARDKRAQDIPLLHELVENDDERQVLKVVSSPESLGTFYFAPPGVPQDRFAVLHAGFDKTLRDEAFLAEAAKLRINVDPMSAAELAKIINDTINVSPEVVAKAKAAMEVQKARATDRSAAR